MEEIYSAKNKAIAMGIIDGLKDQNISVSDAREILYCAQDLIREQGEKQDLKDMLKTML